MYTYPRKLLVALGYERIVPIAKGRRFFNRRIAKKTRQILCIESNTDLGSGRTIFLLARAAGVSLLFSIAIR